MVAGVSHFVIPTCHPDRENALALPSWPIGSRPVIPTERSERRDLVHIRRMYEGIE